MLKEVYKSKLPKEEVELKNRKESLKGTDSVDLEATLEATLDETGKEVLANEGYLDSITEVLFSFKVALAFHILFLAAELLSGDIPYSMPHLLIQIISKLLVIFVIVFSIWLSIRFKKRTFKGEDGEQRAKIRFQIQIILIWECLFLLTSFYLFWRPFKGLYIIAESNFILNFHALIMFFFGPFNVKTSLTLYLTAFLAFVIPWTVSGLFSPLDEIDQILIWATGPFLGGIHSYLKAKRISESHAARIVAVRETRAADRLIGSIMPRNVAKQLRKGNLDVAQELDNATILFVGIDSNHSDIDSVESPENELSTNQDFLLSMNEIYSMFDKLIDQSGEDFHTVERLRQVYLAVTTDKCGSDHAAKTAALALRMQSVLKKIFKKASMTDWTFKIGIHSGPVIATLVGSSNFHYSLFGDNVNCTSRIMTTSENGEIQVSEPTYNLLKENARTVLGSIVRGGGMKLSSPMALNVTESEPVSTDDKLHITTSQYDNLELTKKCEVELKGRDKMMTYTLSGTLSRQNQGIIGGMSRYSSVRSELSHRSRKMSVLSNLSGFERQMEDSSLNLTKSILSTATALSAHKFHDPQVEKLFQEEYLRQGLKFLFITVTALMPLIIAVQMLSFDTIGLESQIYSTIYIADFVIGSFVLYFVRRRDRVDLYKPIGLVILGIYFATTWFENIALVSYNLFLFGVATNIAYPAQFLVCSSIFLRLGNQFLLFGIIYIIGDFVIVAVLGDFNLWSAMMRPLLNFLFLTSATYIQIVQYVAARKHFLVQNEIKRQQDRSKNLLMTLLPVHTMKEFVSAEGKTKNFMACEKWQVTILQLDIAGFTSTVFDNNLIPSEVSKYINNAFSEFDELTVKRKLAKLYTVGDAYVVCGGFPGSSPDHGFEVVSLACDFLSALDKINEANREQNLPDNLDIRIGISSGIMYGGVVSVGKPVYMPWGRVMEEVEYLEKTSQPGNIHLSSTTVDLYESTILRRGLDAKKGSFLGFGKNKVVATGPIYRLNFVRDEQGPYFSINSINLDDVSIISGDDSRPSFTPGQRQLFREDSMLGSLYDES